MVVRSLCAAAAPTGAPHVIEVVDEQTGRGVPLVELETVDRVRFYTDSAGIVAFNEPGLMNQKVYFGVASFGYEFPADGFGFHGTVIDAKPGGTTKLQIKRVNIAERLYRVTGQGIYRDTVLVGRKPPIPVPLLNAQVVGQDSVQATVYRNKAYFFWGDTSQLRYPLGNFSTTGATAPLPGGRGGTDPSAGIPIKYFTDPQTGFTKKMVPLPDAGPVWIDGLLTTKDAKGQERMVAHFSRMKDLGTRLERGLIAFDDASETFKKVADVPLDARLAPGNHAFGATVDGQAYIYFPVPYPCVRVRDDYESVTDLSAYEAYTCLADGVRQVDVANAKLDRDADGKLRFSWKKGTAPLELKEIDQLVKSGSIRREELPFRLRDIDTGKPIELHNGSVYWNEFRKKYVMIAAEVRGATMLGEIFFAESSRPEGPWTNARKILTHRREVGSGLAARVEAMDLYNPTQHPFLDQEGGRILYFEGTYTNSFSGNPVQTPRYEYNQLMHRLDLSDPRLQLPAE